MRTALVAITAAAIGASVALGATTQGWTTFATGTDSSPYGAYSSASADVLRTQGLAVTASLPADVTWNINCQGEDKRATAGEVIPMSVASASSCSVEGDANTQKAGTLQIKLLRR